MLINKNGFILLLLTIFVLAVSASAIIPNADLDADRTVNLDESSALGIGYDINFKLHDSLAVGYKYYNGDFFSWDKSNLVYLKYLLMQRPEQGISLSLFASSFNSEGTMSYGWFGMGGATNFRFAGTNFGPLLSFKLSDWLVLRGAYIIHNITASYASSDYPAIPLYIADPNGIELSWLVNQYLEFNIGISRFGVLGLKAKV